jgi:signal transduction histidine kinase
VLLSTGVALLLGTALVVLIIAVVAQRDAAVGAYRAQESLTAGSQLEKTLISMENGLRGFVASGQERFLAPTRAGLRSYSGELERLDSLVSDLPGQHRRVDRIGVAIDDYVELWARPLIALARERPEAARSVVVTRTGRQRLDIIRVEFAELYEGERTVSQIRRRSAEQRADVAIGVGIVAFGIVLAVAAGLAIFLRRAVVAPVLDVAQASRRLAEGDLDARVPAERDDELGDLARAFNGMADSLQSSRRQLAARTADLERSNAELEQFASITSHDLQAPLVTIAMYAELLERRHGAALDGGTVFVDVIRQSTVQAREMIRDLLEFSRAGRGEPELECVPVSEIVARALEVIRGAVEQAGANVIVEPLPTVLADRSSLCRVFQNLIGNAVKFSDETHPEVVIGAERQGDFWRFEVRDNGIGMDPEHSKRIFEPFKRLHGEERYPGTGIGLAICQRIIAQHGGEIWVDSRPGVGSVFSFTLPAAAGDVEPEEAPAVPVGAGAT